VQGLVILEAMACATPAVAFASGGIPASIEHGVSGFLVPPMDMPALIEGLRHALAPGIAAAWGEAARQRVETRFSTEAFLAGHLALYTEMLRRRTRMAAT
jgi:glycosyltransferase involved in cell wall biosynthesis